MTNFLRPAIYALVLCGSVMVSPLNAISEGTSNKLDGKAIFDKKCLQCHKVEKFRSLQHDRKGWEIILSRMERNKSCILSEDESTAVAEYLSKQYGE